MNTKNVFNFWSVLGVVFWLAILVLVLVKLLVFQQVTVVGMSMEPNYFTSENLLVNQLDKTIHRGQVVAVYRDKEIAKNADYFTRFNATFYLKRVIGLPNEEIEMIGSKVIIYNSNYPQGAVLEETYLGDSVKNMQEQTKFYFPKTKIAEGQYFLMGDNRTNSTDSRSVGAFPSYSIFGQETIRFWPLARVDIFHLPNYKWLPVSDELKADLIKNSQSINIYQDQ